MGLEIDRERFEAHDYDRFQERLGRCLTALEQLLADPGFGEGETSLGAELELSLVGDDARPLPINLKVIGETLDPRVTVELDRFNLECNLLHTMLAGRPFTALRGEIDGALAEVRRAATPHEGRVVAIGILPTLSEIDLQSGAMTQTARFRALSAALQQRRSGPFRVHIDGDEPLEVTCNDVTFEGAATSLQVHLRVAPRRFAKVFNAVQLATAPALAMAGNSPIFLGHRLWQETRVALFKQAVDDRDDRARNQRAPRVCFGADWVQRGAFELFSHAVKSYEPLLPIVGEEDPVTCLSEGGIPGLEEIRLHHGTVWSWNRPVYDPAGGGHLRIELRALPAGPTPVDMLANMAFLVGLSLGLADEMSEVVEQFPFEATHNNFYRAAQTGLDSELAWPAVSGQPGGTGPARELVPRLIPLARRGLVEAGVEPGEIDDLLAVVLERCRSDQTGSLWQRRTLARLEEDLDRPEALSAMLETYMQNADSGRAVHEWQRSG